MKEQVAKLCTMVWLGLGSGCASNRSEPPTDAAPNIDTQTDTQTDTSGSMDGDVGADVSDGEVASFLGPSELATTGLYSDFTKGQIAADVVEYRVRYDLWADGAEKRRFVSIPKGTQIDTRDPDNFRFPIGTKLWKQFAFKDSKPLETRYLHKIAEKHWDMVSYVWSYDGTPTAKAVPLGRTSALGTSHDVPNLEDCNRCHRGVADGAIGLNRIQLSNVIGVTGKPMLTELWEHKMLAEEMPAIDPPGTGLVRDTLGYLHGNCGYCHNDVGLWSPVTTMRLSLRVADSTPESTWAYTTTIGKRANHVMRGGIDTRIESGRPDLSQVYLRTAMRDDWAMPPIGSKIADEAGLKLISEWIVGLKATK